MSPRARLNFCGTREIKNWKWDWETTFGIIWNLKEVRKKEVGSEWENDNEQGFGIRLVNVVSGRG
jgi:hypothetical protein